MNITCCQGFVLIIQKCFQLIQAGISKKTCLDLLIDGLFQLLFKNSSCYLILKMRKNWKLIIQIFHST